MKPLYVIVHEESVYDAGITYPNQDVVIAEIGRIKREEDHTFIGIPGSIPHGLDLQRPILVCGAYYSGFHEGKSNEPQCVDRQLQALLDKGFNASIHEPGALIFTLNSNFLQALIQIVRQSKA